MITFVTLFLFIKYTVGNVYMNVNFDNKTEIRLYNKYRHAVCKNRHAICKVDHKNVCAVRKDKGIMEYKDFENSCQLFMYNFCDSPYKEFFIVTASKCSNNVLSRRNDDISVKNVETTTQLATEASEIDIGNNNSTDNGENKEINQTTDELFSEFTTNTEKIEQTKLITEGSDESSKAILRKQTTKFVRLYEVDTAFDDHICPFSCPEIYSPVCVSANRGDGFYFKFWTFVNHCHADLYYCQNSDEFSPPPDASAEDVHDSKLDWSYCGASRYLQFARFSESTSSLGYYGWLAGDQKYSHIMEPHERKPGYG